MNLASRSTILVALGPGRAVMSRGVFVSVAVVMKSSKLLANLLIGQRLLWCRGCGADFFRARADYSPGALPTGGLLIDAVEIGSNFGGRGVDAWAMEGCHLRFQRK